MTREIVVGCDREGGSPQSPVVALDGVARERGARMIVVGTYGESPFRNAILGSTPHKLLHISETPVLCVRG